jgi:hypothetical protein
MFLYDFNFNLLSYYKASLWEILIRDTLVGGGRGVRDRGVIKEHARGGRGLTKVSRDIFRPCLNNYFTFEIFLERKIASSFFR